MPEQRFLTIHMRREDIKLRLLAKAGDAKAQIKLGEAYLTGTTHILRNPIIGLGYLRAAFRQEPVSAAVSIAKFLQLEEIIEHQQDDALLVASHHDDTARLKMSVWRLLKGESFAAVGYLRQCSPKLLEHVPQEALEGDIDASGLLKALLGIADFNISEIAVRELGVALSKGSISSAIHIFETLEGNIAESSLSVQRLLVDLVERVELKNLGLGSIGTVFIEDSLDAVSATGHSYACYVLGRAYSGEPSGNIPADRLVQSPNLRKAAALLLRAGDGGIAEAWLSLCKICTDYRSSVANPAMARFCLEKAAQHGLPEAERRLGAMTLKDATHIDEMEKGVELLHRATLQGDVLAARLLQTLVQPIRGNEDEAKAAIEEIQRTAPVLAMRLRLARSFGLTKLEALTANPTVGRRPWGLMVSRNPFVSQIRLAEPRAIPAPDADSLGYLEQAAVIFATSPDAGMTLEGSLRARSLQLRRILQTFDVSEEHFFLSASSHQRDVLRVGTKWAQQQRNILQLALA